MSGSRTVTIAVCLYGDYLDPAKITPLIGVDPTLSWKKGAFHITAAGTEVIRRTGLWALRHELVDPDLKVAIAELLDRFGTVRGSLGDLPTVEKARLSLYIGFAASEDGVWEECEISPAVIEQLAVLGLELSMTFSVTSQS